MEIISTKIEDCFILIGSSHHDKRGSFRELYHDFKFRDAKIPHKYLQDNYSISHKNVLRGLHGQTCDPQGKLVTCLSGKVFDVCVDVRMGSPTYLQYFSLHLSEHNDYSLYIPPGCLHGFLSLEDNSLVHYKCTTLYDKASDGGVRWDDPTINIQWPKTDGDYIISDKDKNLLFVQEYLKVCGAV